MKLNDYLDFHPDIENALKNNLPIVALESTIISHGMPYPKNIETALMVEETVRSNNAVPATIAIIKGRLKIGLTEKEIEFLATNDEIKKISRRDLAIAVSQQLSGSTTVASTMIIAKLANIAVFATGGIGGIGMSVCFVFWITTEAEAFIVAVAWFQTWGFDIIRILHLHVPRLTLHQPMKLLVTAAGLSFSQLCRFT